MKAAGTGNHRENRIITKNGKVVAYEAIVKIERRTTRCRWARWK